MERFYTLVAGALLTVVLVLTIRKQNGELAMMLGLCGCIMVLGSMAHFMRPVMSFIQKIQSVASLDRDMLQILLKVTAVSFVAEIASLVCNDAGNAALGKTLQIMSAVVILWLALPMLEALLNMVERILVNL